MKKLCGVHGEFESYTVLVKDRHIETDCPLCIEESIKNFDRERSLELKRMADEAHARYIAEHVKIPRRYIDATLDNFNVLTEAHRVPLEVSKKFLRSILLGNDDRLILLGRTGTGKTHLGCAVAKAYAMAGRMSTYIKAQALVDLVREAILNSGKSISTTIPDLIRDGLLVLDEVGSFGSEKEFHIEVVSEAIDYCDGERLPIMLMANCDANKLVDVLGDRAADRMNNATLDIVTMGYESYRGKENV